MCWFVFFRRNDSFMNDECINDEVIIRIMMIADAMLVDSPYYVLWVTLPLKKRPTYFLKGKVMNKWYGIQERGRTPHFLSLLQLFFLQILEFPKSQPTSTHKWHQGYISRCPPSGKYSSTDST